jgi:Rieske Fe-S protein
MKLIRKTSAEPLWKDEFSVNAGDERYVTRRQFTKFLVLSSLGMFVGNLWILAKAIFLKPPQYAPQIIGKVGEIPVGGVKIFTYPNPEDPCILVRTGEDEYVAYTQKCTHLSCAIYFSKEKGELICPCHDGAFAVQSGAVLQGPPRRPLPRVVIERRGENLVAVRMETTPGI